RISVEGRVRGAHERGAGPRQHEEDAVALVGEWGDQGDHVERGPDEVDPPRQLLKPRARPTLFDELVHPRPGRVDHAARPNRDRRIRTTLERMLGPRG